MRWGGGEIPEPMKLYHEKQKCFKKVILYHSIGWEHATFPYDQKNNIVMFSQIVFLD